MTEPLGQFEGLEQDQRVRLSIYDSHIEIAVHDDPGGPAIKIPFDELGSVEVQEVLGMKALVIEDTAGIVAATVRMDQSDVDQAMRLVDNLQGRG